MQPFARRQVHLIRVVLDELSKHVDRDFLGLTFFKPEVHEHLGFFFFEIVAFLIVEIKFVFEGRIHVLQDQ